MRLLKKIGLSVLAAIAVVLFSASAAEAEETERYVLKGTDDEITVYKDGVEVLFGTFGDIFSFVMDKPEAILVGDGVKITKPQTLPCGSFHMSGDYQIEAPIHIPDKTSLTLTDVAVHIGKNGYFHVKGGTLRMDGGTLTADETAFRLDFAASSYLYIGGGDVKSEKTAIVSTLGTVKIAGGRLLSASENAIVSFGTLMLSGSPAITAKGVAVKTNEPPFLSIDGVPFVGTVSLMSMRTYVVGDFAVAAYAAISGSEENIRFFDAAGNSVPLIFEEESPFTEETSFLAVSIPYTLCVYQDGTVVEEIKDFSFCPASIQGNYEKIGFTFVGWYERGSDVPFSDTVKRNLDIEAKYRLSPPTFSISSVSFEFDGTVHALSFSVLSHPLAEEGLFSYQWSKDGEILPYAGSGLLLRSVKDSGTYACTVFFTYGNESVSVKTPPISVRITPKIIAFPSAKRASYDTEKHKAVFAPSADYSLVETTEGINVGCYPYVLRLSDSENTVWIDGTNEDAMRYFEIEKAENVWLTPLSADISYEGKEPAIQAKSLYGEVQFWFAKEGASLFFYTST